ncbi:hypothetical protein L1987_23709 [Smallanthus sonchifolius]|uniref:Uncharacterized protein n=1 Tax=Smallanthus sonchifolius TaxID=185202 RepID=A0ACB9IJW7_9ASTR|nr:hypothetical protein L1987_23709 [Smallanthus sonchifolius]
MLGETVVNSDSENDGDDGENGGDDGNDGGDNDISEDILERRSRKQDVPGNVAQPQISVQEGHEEEEEENPQLQTRKRAKRARSPPPTPFGHHTGQVYRRGKKMMSRKGKELAEEKEPTPEHPKSPIRIQFDDEILNMIANATTDVISQLRTQVANLKENENRQYQEIARLKSIMTNQQHVIIKMMKMIVELQNIVNLQPETITLSKLFDFEGFVGETIGVGPSGTNTGEELLVRFQSLYKDEDDEDQSDMSLGSFGSTYTSGDDEEVFVEQTSIDQGTKPTQTNDEGQVLDDIDAEDNSGDSDDASSRKSETAIEERIQPSNMQRKGCTATKAS